MTNILSLSNVIDVSILSVPSLLGEPNINTAALFSQETPSGWGPTQAFAIYTSASEVAEDFGSDSDAFAIATAFFAQQPNPISTGGYLAVIPRLQTPSLETVQAAILRTLDLVFYFGILIDEEMSGDPSAFASLCEYVQTLDKMFFYCSSVSSEFAPNGMLDLVRQAGETQTRCLYYNNGTALDTPAFAAAYAGRGLSTNFSGNRTTQTMHLKTMTNFEPDPTMTQTLLNAAVTAGVDTYVSIAGVPSLFTSGANSFYDEIYNEFWLKFALETAGFNYLRATSTKIPQTEAGVEGLKNVYRRVCDQGISNGFLAPGEWTSPDVFGDPASLITNIETIGYYVYSTPLSQQSTADRDARQAPLIQIAVKTAGAIQKSSVIVNVNL